MAAIKKLKAVKIEQNHLLGIQGLSFSQISQILDQAKEFIALNKSTSKKLDKNAACFILQGAIDYLSN